MREVIEFAKNNGYETSVRVADRKGYKCYEPLIDENGFAQVGPPLLILVRDKIIRMSTVEEAFQRLDALPDDEQEDE